MKNLRDISITGSINEPINEEVILQSIENMFNIRYGDLIFNRNIGTEIEDILFEPFTFSTKQRLEHIILKNMMSQIPLAKIKSLVIDMDYVKAIYNVRMALEIEGVGLTEYNKNLKSKG